MGTHDAETPCPAGRSAPAFGRPMHGTVGARLSAVRRVEDASRAAIEADRDALDGAGRPLLLELQWHSRGGRFRHSVVVLPGLLRVLGASAIVASVAVAGALSLGSTRAPERLRVDAVLRENGQLAARQTALRRVAFDLAERLYRRFEQQGRMTGLATTVGYAQEEQCPRPPARNAGNEEIFAWLSEQGARLEALGYEPAAVGVGIDGRRASVPARAPEGPPPLPPTADSRSVNLPSASQHEAAPAKP